MQQAVVDFIGKMNPGDYAAIVKFNASNPGKASVVQPFTQIDGGAGSSALVSAVMAPYPGWDTNLYDAVVLSVKQFTSPSTPLPAGPKAVILLSDGAENSSGVNFSTMVTTANAASIPVFTIGVGNVASNPTSLTIMTELAKQTGGQYLPATDAAQISGAYATIRNLLNNEYLLSFTSSITDCSPHNLEVRVSGQAAPATATFTRCTSTGVDLKSLTLKSSVVAGCKSVVGTVVLPSAAPPEGAVVKLSDTLAVATLPATITVPAGATSATFFINTTPVVAKQSGVVRATRGSTTLSQNLIVRPIGMLSVTLTPTTAVGGKSVAGSAKLECAAGPGPITVTLGSSNPAVAHPVATSIVVPQGLQSRSFTVTTAPVLAATSATIHATANGIRKSKALNLISAGSVTPASLQFGYQVIGTGRSLNATLSNKGALPYSVLSIGITGTNASSFAKSTTCSATLAAGASCTIAVRFRPTTTGSKTAKLSIATSATATPLAVSLSGTGVLP